MQVVLGVGFFQRFKGFFSFIQRGVENCRFARRNVFLACLQSFENCSRPLDFTASRQSRAELNLHTRRIAAEFDCFLKSGDGFVVHSLCRKNGAETDACAGVILVKFERFFKRFDCLSVTAGVIKL